MNQKNDYSLSSTVPATESKINSSPARTKGGYIKKEVVCNFLQLEPALHGTGLPTT